jgi:uncharacterized protein (DUF952 family)
MEDVDDQRIARYGNAMLVYKIFQEPEWQAMRDAGQSSGASIDLADGFVHLSTGEQAAETAAKHFAEQSNLVLLAFDSEAMGPELKWEPSRGRALFPHLYRSLQLDEVLWARPLPLADGQHVFPDGLR